MQVRTVYLTVSTGDSVRDLLRLGMLDELLKIALDVRVILLTPAYLVQEFRQEFESERVLVRRHELYSGSGYRQRGLTWLRRRVRSRFFRDMLLSLEERQIELNPYMEEVFREFQPDLVVTSHPKTTWDFDLLSYARRHKIPTAGIVRSWDNLLFGIYCLPDRLSVWDKTMKQEAMGLHFYRPDHVTVTGPAPFDRYFLPEVIQSREDFCRSLKLDPNRPIVTYGTCGTLSRDETYLLDLLLEMSDRFQSLSNAQFVCRLHPVSRLEHFWQYRNNPKVTYSFSSYIKALGWSMTRDEVDNFANLLHHSDVVICPWSTLVLESMIMDTPTIVPAFSTIQPDDARSHLQDASRLNYRMLVKNGWIPIARSPEELEEMISLALRDRTWRQEDRRAAVNERFPSALRDGKSGRRVAEFILGAMDN